MAYKRYFYRNGKKFGPYYYESYRDNTGKVRKKYIGTENPDEKKIKKIKKSITPTLILAIFLGIFILLTIFVILQVYKNDMGISFTGKLFQR